MKSLSCLASALVLAAGLPAQAVRYRDELFPQATTQTDLAFGAAHNPWSNQLETLRLDLHEPAGDAATGRAAVVVVHGGGFVSGDKASPQIVFLSRQFARRGYVAISINYRLAPPSTDVQANLATLTEDTAEDFKAAVRWLRAMAGSLGIDGDRIAAIGTSAGGYAVLGGAYLEGEGQSGNPGFSSEIAAVASLWGGLPDDSEIEAGEAPVILVHGTLDGTVPFSESQEVFAQAQVVGIPGELHPIVGAGHAPWGPFLSLHLDDVIGFFYEHLKLGQLSGLALEVGQAGPGTLGIASTGVAGDLRWLGVSTGPATIPAGPLGTLCLDPTALALLPLPPLPSTPRLPTAITTLPLPPFPAGTTFRLQELQAPDPTTPRLLTNCATLVF